MKKKCITIRDFFDSYCGFDDATLDMFTHEDVSYVYRDVEQYSVTEDTIRMLYDDTVISVVDSKNEISFYRNPILDNKRVCPCTKVNVESNMRITINDIDLDELSIYELEHLLVLLKKAQQETEIRIIAKKLRKKGVMSRGRKRALLRKINEEESEL